MEVGDFATQGDLLHIEVACIAATIHQRKADAPRDVGPAVGHQIHGEVLPREHRGEVFPALPLPAWRQPCIPLPIRLAVAPQIYGGGGALKHVEVLGVLPQEGNALNGRGAGADDAHTLIRKLMQIALVIAAGVRVIPAGGVEAMALKAIDARNLRQLRPVSGARGLDQEARVEHVPPVRGEAPALSVFLPSRILHPGLEERELIKAEVLPNPASVLEDLRSKGIFLLRHVARFFQERQVAVGFDIALGAGVTVPVPGSAEIASGFDEQHVLDAPLLQPGRGHKAAEAASHDHHVDVALKGLPRRLHRVGVFVGVTGEVLRSF